MASIVGMGKAAELYNYSPDRDKRCKEIHNKFYQSFAQMKDVHFNTDINNSISTTLNVSFKGVESESLMLLLDMGVFVYQQEVLAIVEVLKHLMFLKP